MGCAVERRVIDEMHAVSRVAGNDGVASRDVRYPSCPRVIDELHPVSWVASSCKGMMGWTHVVCRSAVE